MDRITPLQRAILDALDTCEHGAGDTEIGVIVLNDITRTVYSCFEELQSALVELLDVNLIFARFREQPRDLGVTADPIIYALTEEGCEALWALQRAEAAAFRAQPCIGFQSRAAMREFLSGAMR